MEYVKSTFVLLFGRQSWGSVSVSLKVWAATVTDSSISDGTHSLSSPSHLSLLFSRTFNVSIPLQHIPNDLYEFEHTDGVTDDRFSGNDEDDVDGRVHEVGRWKVRKNGKLLGEGGKGIKFTVIGWVKVFHFV